MRSTASAQFLISQDQTTSSYFLLSKRITNRNSNINLPKMLMKAIAQLLLISYASAISVTLHNNAGVSAAYAVNPDGSCCKLYPASIVREERA